MNLDQKAILVSKALKAILVSKDPRATLAHKVYKALKVNQEKTEKTAKIRFI